MGIAEKGGAWIRIYPDGVEHEKGNELVLSNGDVCKFNGMSAYIDYMNDNDELYEYIRARVEGHSFTESLPEEEIAILEKANAADMTEEEYMEQLDEVLAPSEEE
jgi:hypothetical protein